MLARDRFGRLGEYKSSDGRTTNVDAMPIITNHDSLTLTNQGIARSHARQTESARVAKAVAIAQGERQKAKAQFEHVQHLRKKAEIEKFQNVHSLDPKNEMLKRHFAVQKNMGSDARSVSSLRSYADFRAVDAELESGQLRPKVWLADFRAEAFRGNPLTRDGVFGPLTDFERTIQTHFPESKNEDVWDTRSTKGMPPHQKIKKYTPVQDGSPPLEIAGGTSLGRWNDSLLDPPGYTTFKRKMREKQMNGTMGNALTDWLSDAGKKLSTSVQTSALKQADAALNKEIAKITGQGGKVVSQSGGTITVQQQAAGLPPWAMYAAIGLAGVGAVLLLKKKR